MGFTVGFISTLLPLGDHGLIGAGTHEDTAADSAVLDVAKALADHVTTALDRVEREQAVRESFESDFETMLAERLRDTVAALAPDHGDVAVTTVAIEDSAAGYVVMIEDDGPGIPEEELVPIEAGTETNLQHGRGLGLWQLRWSVDRLGGELSFDTGEGTTVRITIPDRGRRL